MKTVYRRRLIELADIAKYGKNLADRFEAIGGLAVIIEYLFRIDEISECEYEFNKKNLEILDSELRAVLGLEMSIGGVR